MALLNLAFLSALLPAVLAIPGHGGAGGWGGKWGAYHKNHAPVKAAHLPSNFPTGFPHPPAEYHQHHRPFQSGASLPPSAAASSAPFPAGNSTALGPSGPGSGLGTGTGLATAVPSYTSAPPVSDLPGESLPPIVTIKSTLLVVPLPVGASEIPESSESTGVPGGPGQPGPGASPSHLGAPGAPGSGSGSGPGSSPSVAPGSGSGSGSGAVSSPSTAPGAPGTPGPGSEGSESAGVCGPSVVTITQAKTVTVTVPAAPESEAPGPSQPSVPEQPSEAPEQPSEILPQPSQPTESSVLPSAPFPINNGSASAGPTAPGTIGSLSAYVTSSSIYPPISPVVAPSSPVVPVEKPKAELHPPAAPAPIAPSVPNTKAEKPSVPETSSFSKSEKPHLPETANSPESEKPHAPQTISPPKLESPHAPEIVSSPETKEAPTSNNAESPPPKKQSSPSTSGVKPRGLLYASGGLPAAQAFDKSNIGWCADWDSSVTPGNGANIGEINCQFVPMLHSIDDNHLHWWQANTAKGFDYLAGFNEPDNCGGGGACMSEADAAQNWNQYMKPKSGKLVSPAVQNTGDQWMSNFLDQCSECNIQALAFHWYGEVDDIDETPGSLANTVKTFKALAEKHGIPELWISEMAPRSTPTADQMSAYLKFLENPENGVTRYAFNGLNTGTGIDLVGALAEAYCAA